MFKNLQEIRRSIPPCSPPFWASTGHLQTILGHLIPSPKIKELGQEFKIPLNKESEIIHTTYFKGERPVVIYLFHGLGGSAEATYMQRTALVARQLGYHVFISNHRGCGAGMGLASEPYHSGRSDDLSKVIEFGRNMFPDFKHAAVGFSLSANALLLLVSKFKGDVLPDLAIAVNGPIHLDKASLKLCQGLNRIYDQRFLRDLRRYLKVNNPEKLLKAPKIKDLREFDEVFTAPLGGFESRADYYQICSAKQYLHRIEVPTVLLTAKDDPFVGYEDYENAKLSASTVLHMEDHGGHMGYLTGKGFKAQRWLDKALRSYLEVLEEQKKE